MNLNQPVDLPWYGWFALVLLLGAQGSWLFLDARQKGERAWFWGLWGLIQTPMPLLFYWLFVLRRHRR